MGFASAFERSFGQGVGIGSKAMEKSIEEKKQNRIAQAADDLQTREKLETSQEGEIEAAELGEKFKELSPAERAVATNKFKEIKRQNVADETDALILQEAKDTAARSQNAIRFHINGNDVEHLIPELNKLFPENEIKNREVIPVLDDQKNPTGENEYRINYKDGTWEMFSQEEVNAVAMDTFRPGDRAEIEKQRAAGFGAVARNESALKGTQALMERLNIEGFDSQAQLEFLQMDYMTDSKKNQVNRKKLEDNMRFANSHINQLAKTLKLTSSTGVDFNMDTAGSQEHLLGQVDRIMREQANNPNSLEYVTAKEIKDTLKIQMNTAYAYFQDHKKSFQKAYGDGVFVEDPRGGTVQDKIAAAGTGAEMGQPIPTGAPQKPPSVLTGGASPTFTVSGLGTKIAEATEAVGQDVGLTVWDIMNGKVSMWGDPKALKKQVLGD